MARKNYLFTSESVSEGHPDKVCDRISDEIVDLVYREALTGSMDPWAVRCACETLTTTNKVVIAGEVRIPEKFVAGDGVVKEPFVDAARAAIKDIGYEQDGFHWESADVDVLLHAQSADIAQGVDNAADADNQEGAGDQGIMFGYACRETAALMPAPIYYSHRILQDLATARHNKNGEAGYLGPDAKSQVTVRYADGAPREITSIVLSTQHLDASWSSAKVREVVEPHIRDACAGLPIAADCEWHVNPTGKFVIGGPDGDAGLTGRKIIVDTYGGAAPHGGGAFSGKDTTKVDRSAAYAARYLAKNVVAADLAERCTIQLSYAIGVAHPLSVYVDLHDTGKDVAPAALEKVLREVMDLSPSGIRRHLALNKPIYARTAAYGHFGRAADADGGFSWEKTDLADALKTALR
ncbi:MAG: methionine adenosyltransferase [Parvularculaceae bacterium]|nr:MAG: methionine adenosyltransferase [Parvularculaceae bacterium]